MKEAKVLARQPERPAVPQEASEQGSCTDGQVCRALQSMLRSFSLAGTYCFLF